MTNDDKSTGLHTLREVFSLVWAEANSFVKARLIIVLVLITAASAVTALGPVALKLVIDGFTGSEKVPAMSIALLISMYVSSQWLARSMGEIRGLIYARAERRMSRTLSERLFGHILRLPLRFHVDRQTGAVTQSLTNGLQGYQMVLQTLVFSVLPVITELATVVFVLSRLGQPFFLALFCAAIACYASVFTYAARKTTKAARRASGAQVDATATMTDSILNYETVKYFAAEALVEHRVGGALTRTEDEWVRFYRQFAVNGLCVATIYALFLGVTILYAAREVHEKRMSIGTWVLINTYMLQIVRPVEMLGYAVQNLSQGIAYFASMLALFREQAEDLGQMRKSAPTDRHTEDAEARTDSRTQSEEGRAPALEFQNVRFSYRPDPVTLQEVSFRLPTGKTLAIVGSSGSGKSTIVRLLVRLFEPDGGRILIDGVPVGELALSTLREAIAVVPQDTALFNDSIAFNIAFGKAGSTREEVEQAAKLARLHEFIMRLPDGYETRVGERGVKLSGGEKQRVAIARAAIKRPWIYVYDEATSSLDSGTEQDILKNLREISRFRTTLVIAHRLSTVVHADEIVVLESGIIVERGTHASLLAQNGRYTTLWRNQQSSTARPAAGNSC